MKTISLQFDSLEFIPVLNNDGELFAFEAKKYPNKLWNSEKGTSFNCFPINDNGNLEMNVTKTFKKENLMVVWVSTVCYDQS